MKYKIIYTEKAKIVSGIKKHHDLLKYLRENPDFIKHF